MESEQEEYNRKLDLSNLNPVSAQEIESALAEASTRKSASSSQPKESSIRSALVENLMANHPGLTREKANQALDEAGA